MIHSSFRFAVFLSNSVEDALAILRPLSNKAHNPIKKIKYPMLADPTGLLTRNFGVHIEEAGLAYRGTFLINPEGEIKLAEVNDNGIGRNADELLRKVKAAQYIAKNPNEVCPAKWKEGSETLKPGLDLVGKI